ncbi:MAG: phosphoribosyltransferase [Candidatus Hodarchaeales archaeon]|jgi:predicted phosphoribosyltransferase
MKGNVDEKVMIIEDNSLRNKYRVFPDRQSAGRRLSNSLKNQEIDLILAIPNGGVPVAEPLVMDHEQVEFSLLLIRKIQLPWSTEAGFGAVTPDGQVFFNQQMLDRLHLKDKAIDRQVGAARDAIAQRQQEYGLESYDVKNRIVLLVDDGIASGFSMIAGATWLREKGAKEVVVGVPTAPLDSLKRIKTRVDNIYCLNVRTLYPFAVADAYEYWYDVPSTEVRQILRRIHDYHESK